MKIGTLRHRVTIQAPTYTRATDGSTAITYSGSLTIWANVIMDGQSESIQSDKKTSTETITVIVRYSNVTEPITEKYQLVWNGSSYGITGIVNDERLIMRTIKADKIK
jgi:SPP1 family predicted phage head-tail adaptor